MDKSNLSGNELAFVESVVEGNFHPSRWTEVARNMKKAFSFEDAKIYFRMNVTADWSRRYFLDNRGNRVEYPSLDWDAITHAMLEGGRKRRKPYPIRIALFHQRTRNYLLHANNRYMEVFNLVASDNFNRYRRHFSALQNDRYTLVSSSEIIVEDREKFIRDADVFCRSFTIVDEPGNTPSKLIFHVEIGNMLSTSGRNRLCYIEERIANS